MRPGARSITALVLTVLFFLSAHAPTIPVTAQGVTLTISPLDPSSVYVEVNATEPGIAVFNATVTVTKPPAVTVTVTMDADCTAGWPVTVYPETLTFVMSGSENVTATVIVPQGTPAHVQETVGVFAIANYPGGSVNAQATGIVNIVQYFDGKVEAPLTTSKTDTMVVNMTIINKGNGLDSYEIEILDRSAEESKGLEFDFSETEVKNIGPEEYEVIKLTVEYTGSALPFEHEFQVRLTSTYAQQEGQDPYYWDFPVSINFKKPDNGGTNGNNGGNGTEKTFLEEYGLYLAIIVLILVVVIALGAAASRKKSKPRKRSRRSEEE